MFYRFFSCYKASLVTLQFELIKIIVVHHRLNCEGNTLGSVI